MDIYRERLIYLLARFSIVWHTRYEAMSNGSGFYVQDFHSEDMKHDLSNCYPHPKEIVSCCGCTEGTESKDIRDHLYSMPHKICRVQEKPREHEKVLLEASFEDYPLLINHRGFFVRKIAHKMLKEVLNG